MTQTTRRRLTGARLGGATLAACLAAGLLVSAPSDAAPRPSGAVLAAPSLADDAITAAEFKNPGVDSRPATRWWWQAPLSLDESVREINAIAKAGYGEVEIAFSTGAWADQTQRDNLQAVLAAAKTLGVEVSMTMGAAWPVQTPNTSVGTQYVQKELQYGYAEVGAGQTFNAAVPQAFDQPTLAKTNSKLVGVSVAKVLDRGPAVGILPEPRPRFGTPYAVPSRSTVLDQASMKDVSDKVVDGKLTWTAPTDGAYMVFSYWERDAAKAVTSAFNTEAAKAATQYLDENQIGAANVDLLKQVGDSMFEDSLELNADSLFWSQDFLSAFQAEFGYSMLPYLPLMYQHGMSRYWVPTVRPTPDFALADGTNQKVLNDYYTFITSRYINRSKVFQDWAEAKYGMTWKSQPAFGQDLEPIRVIREFARDGAKVEGESFNSGDRWPIDSTNAGWKSSVDWQRVVASGAHQGGTTRVTTELGASREVTYELNLREYKEMMDKEWAAGFSKPVLHGFAYQSVGATWPGKTRFGDTTSESWNDNFPQWADMKSLTDYWARGTEVLETGTPRTDVAIYRDDFLTTAARLNTDEGTQPAELFNTKAIEKLGYSVQFVDPVGLSEDGVVGNGTLFPQGPGYRALVVDQRSVSAKAAQAIAKAAAAGVKVVFVGSLPAQDTTFSSGKAGDDAVKTAIAAAVASPNAARVETQGDVAGALTALGAQARTSWGTGDRVLTQTREVNGTTYVYMYNTSRKDIDFTPAFEADGGVSRMDLASGDIRPADTWSTQGGRTLVPTHMKALETVVYAINSSSDQVHVVSSTNPEDTFLYRNGTITLRSKDEGTRTVVLSNGRSKRLTVRPADEIYANPGPLVWALSVNAVTADGGSKTINVGNLPAYYPPYDWRDIAAIKGESGTGTYTGTLTVPTDWVGTGKGVELNLGRVEGTARIYINDTFVGTTIDDDIPFDVSPYLKAGANAIKVEVRTTLRNAVTQYKGTAPRTQEYGLRGTITWKPFADAVVFDAATEPADPTPGTAPASSTLDVTAAGAVFGKPVPVSVKVTTADGKAPTGKVTVSSSTRVLAETTVGPGGVATLQLAGLPVGTNALTATYEGSATAKATSKAFTVDVTKASSRLRTRAKATGKGKVKVSAVVFAPAGARAGKIVVRENGRKVGSFTTGADGEGRTTLRGVRRGAHTYVVVFKGSGAVDRSKDEVGVRVRR